MDNILEESEVHYVLSDNEHCPATILKVWHKENGVVDLVARISEEIPEFKAELVLYSPENHSIHTWHFPEELE